MTPYHDPDPGPQQWYNVAHCRTRAMVEMTIGILKARFQCLRRLRVTPDRACDIIVACVVLHNIATIRGEQHPALQIDLVDDHPLHPADGQDGKAVRHAVPHTQTNPEINTHQYHFMLSSLLPENRNATMSNNILF